MNSWFFNTMKRKESFLIQRDKTARGPSMAGYGGPGAMASRQHMMRTCPPDLSASFTERSRAPGQLTERPSTGTYKMSLGCFCCSRKEVLKESIMRTDQKATGAGLRGRPLDEL